MSKVPTIKVFLVKNELNDSWVVSVPQIDFTATGYTGNEALEKFHLELFDRISNKSVLHIKEIPEIAPEGVRPYVKIEYFIKLPVQSTWELEVVNE